VSDLDSTVPDAVRAALAEEGSVALVAADASVSRLAAVLRVAGLDVPAPPAPGPASQGSGSPAPSGQGHGKPTPSHPG